MQAEKLYNALNRDFVTSGITDLNWACRITSVERYLCEGFRRTGIGLMCDFAQEIEAVYSTVFLSDKVLQKILADDVANAMIFSHHPSDWEVERQHGSYAATEEYIAELQNRNISIYVLHLPLDHYGEYGTGKTLADRMGITVERPAFSHGGALCGVVGTINCNTVGELHERFSKVMGHTTSLYPYGRKNIRGEKVVVCPGRGNILSMVDEMLRNNHRILLTGVTTENDGAKEAHRVEKENGVSLLGGTHYSTEKFACIEMCRYFTGLGLPVEFVEDAPRLSDL